MALLPNFAEPADHLDEFLCSGTVVGDVSQEIGQLGNDLLNRMRTIGIRAKHLGLLDGRFQILLRELAKIAHSRLARRIHHMPKIDLSDEKHAVVAATPLRPVPGAEHHAQQNE